MAGARNVSRPFLRLHPETAQGGDRKSSGRSGHLKPGDLAFGRWVQENVLGQVAQAQVEPKDQQAAMWADECGDVCQVGTHQHGQVVPSGNDLSTTACPRKMTKGLGGG